MASFKKFCVFIQGFIIFLGANAQKSDSVTTIIFSRPQSSIYKTVKKVKQLKNIIKVAPTGVLVGQFPLIYERRFADNFSIQFAGGITSQNYIRTAIELARDMDNNNVEYPWSNVNNAYDVAPKIYNFSNGRKVANGSMFSIQPKLYLNDEALDGSYVGFSISNIDYKFTIPQARFFGSGIKFSGPEQSEKERITDFMVHFGNQSVNNHFCFEYSFAMGIRKINGTKYVATTDGTTNSTIYDGFINYNRTTFNTEFALRVGYVF